LTLLPTPCPYTTLFRSHSRSSSLRHANAVPFGSSVPKASDRKAAGITVTGGRATKGHAARRSSILSGGLHGPPNARGDRWMGRRSEEHTSELQSRENLV